MTTETIRFGWPFPAWNADWTKWQEVFSDLINNVESTVFGNLSNSKLIMKDLPSVEVKDLGGSNWVLAAYGTTTFISRNLLTPVVVGEGNLSLTANSIIGVTITPGAVGPQSVDWELYDQSVGNYPEIVPVGYVDESFNIIWYNGAQLTAGGGVATLFESVTIGSADTLDDGYDNFGSNPATVVVDGAQGQGDITWDLDGDYSLNVDLGNTTNSSDGFQVYDGVSTEYFRLIRKLDNQIDLETQLRNIDFDASGDLGFKDQYLSSSINLSESGESSLDTTSQTIVGAINELHAITTGIDLDDAYDNFGSSPATVNIDDAEGQGELKFVVGLSNNFVVDVAGASPVNGSTHGFKVEDGTDYFRLVHNSANNLDLLTEVNNIDWNVSGYYRLDATEMSIDSTSASNLSVTGGNLTVSTITSGNLVLGAADDVDMDGANVYIDAITAFSINGASASNVSVTGANLTLSTLASGNLILMGSGDVTLNDQYLSGAITLSESGETGLDTTSQSIVGAINEIHGEIVAESLWDRSSTVLYPQNAGDTLAGGTGSGDDLTFNSTTHATKGNIILGGLTGMVYDETNRRLGIGTNLPSSRLDLYGLGDLLELNDGTTEVRFNLNSNVMTIANLGGLDRVHIQVDLTIDGQIGIGTSSPSTLLDLEEAGTAKATVDFLEITNTANAVDMDGTGTGILFNQWYYDAGTPAVADAGRIAVITETDWTSTASTQDSYMSFQTALDGAVSEKMRITSGGDVGIGVTPTYKFSIGSTNNSDQIGIYHDNSNAYFRTTDGAFIFQNDDTIPDLNTYLDIRGNGTGTGYLRVMDQDDNEYVSITCSVGKGFIETHGNSPQDLYIQGTSGAIHMFESSLEGDTRELQIYGYRTGDSKRSLQIGVGVDADDTASFDGLSNYYFDGNVGIGTSSPSTLLDIEKAGTATSTVNFLDITNTANAASMVGTGTSIKFNQYAYHATIPLVNDAAYISAVTETNWQAGVASTQDASLVFETVSAGISNEKFKITSNGQLINQQVPIELADDGSFNLPASSAGVGFFLVGDAEEYAQVVWDSSANVDLIISSANVTDADTDGYFCVFDNGTYVQVRNRLGTAKKVVVTYSYYTP